MAKFFITNNQQYYKSLKEQIGNGNFQISFDYTKEGLYSIAVHKLGMHNQNAVQVVMIFALRQAHVFITRV